MYNEFYGFREAPFNITPDPRFLFFSDKHREAFNHLLYGIRERKGFIQLTGEVGAGKTTLCRAMLEELGALQDGADPQPDEPPRSSCAPSWSSSASSPALDRVACLDV